MNAKEILDKIKEVVLGAEQVELSKDVAEVETVAEEVKPTELAEETMEEEKVEVKEEAPAPVIEMDKYATKEELASQLSELKAVINQLKDIIDPKKDKDVPEELAKVEVELEAEPLVHSPEEELEKTQLHNYSPKKTKGTKALIYDKLFNK